MPHHGLIAVLCLLVAMLAAQAGAPALAPAPESRLLTPPSGAAYVEQTHLGIPVRYYRPGTGASWPRPVIEDFALNTRLFRAVNGWRSPAADAVFTALLPLGKMWVLIPVLLLVLRFRRAMLAPLVVSQVLCLVVTQLPKKLFTQPRPGLLLQEGVVLLEPVWKGSFPSGDTTLVFALAALFAPGSRWWVQVLWWGYACLIAYGRMYVGAHFPLDVCAGACLGVACAWLARWVITWHDRRTRITAEPATTGARVV